MAQIFENCFIETMHAGDGGLLCIVPLNTNKRKHPSSIMVVNPLTTNWRELPELPHALRSVQPSMVQLMMDQKSKSYKVLVVGPNEERLEGGAEISSAAASIYSSVTKQWSSVKDLVDIVFGYRYDWEDAREDSDWGGNDRGDDLDWDHDAGREDDAGGGNDAVGGDDVGGEDDAGGADYTGRDDDDQYFSVNQRFGAYDCANGVMVNLSDGMSPWRELLGIVSYCLVKDHLFVLHEETYETRYFSIEQRYCISEYAVHVASAQRRQPHWIKLGPQL